MPIKKFSCDAERMVVGGFENHQKKQGKLEASALDHIWKAEERMFYAEAPDMWDKFIPACNNLLDIMNSAPWGNLPGHFWIENSEGRIIDHEFPVYKHIRRRNKCKPFPKFKPVYQKAPQVLQDKMIQVWITPIHTLMKECGLKRKHLVGNPLFRPSELCCNLNALVEYIEHAKEGYRIVYGSMGWVVDINKADNKVLVHFEFDYKDKVNVVGDDDRAPALYEEVVRALKSGWGQAGQDDSGFGTCDHDGSGFADCDPDNKGYRKCKEEGFDKSEWCSECVYLSAPSA